MTHGEAGGEGQSSGGLPFGFRRVAIVNRGEPAMRFIHAARELNHEEDAGLRTIALFTDPDRGAMFVREADEAVALGPATFVDPRDGQRKSSYLDYAGLERALLAARADAVWVGWGFVAEHAEFAELCRRLGIVFIGPTPDSMRALGDKITAKRVAEQVGVRVAPWSGGPVETLEDARGHGQRLGYPLLIKASAGGGGRGIRTVRAEAELPDAFETARAEALKAFGDATVFMERVVAGARHIEVQVIADHHGTTWAVGVRDCTIQRRSQKVLEEAPSPVLSPEQDRDVRAAAVRIAAAVGYHNAGTVEFLYAPEEQAFLFMETNTRLQVEHPVTEMTTGLDLVKLQVHVARGGRLEGQPPETVGHAIEVRLNAEDPDAGFAPAPGAIELLRLATGPGLRVDTGVAQGDVVPSEFDSMIAKLIACGRTRREALGRLARGLAETDVVIAGGTSNKAFLLALLERPEVVAATFDNRWLDRLTEAGEHVPRRHAHLALVAAAIEAYDAALAIEEARFFAGAARGRPLVRQEVGHVADLRHRGHTYRASILRRGGGRYQVRIDGRGIDASIERLGRFERTLTCSPYGGQRFRVLAMPDEFGHQIEVDGVLHRVSGDDAGTVRAPAPAIVVSVAVGEGDHVAAGDRLAVLEAMKMEMAVTAPFAGRVRQVLVRSNVQVGTGTPLVLLEPLARIEDQVGTERVYFDALVPTVPAEATPAERWRRNLGGVRDLLLGFDVDPADVRQLLAERTAICASLPAADAALREGEDELLATFVDVSALFQAGRAAGEEAEETTVQGPEELLRMYLRAIDEGVANLPRRFVEALRRALAHYGVRSLDPSPELRESLLWLYKAHQRHGRAVEVILSVLERRLANAALLPVADDAWRHLLDRLVALTEGRPTALGDLARQVRHRYFDQPLSEAARRSIYQRMDEELARLAEGPAPEERAARIATLVDCPQPLVGLCLARFEPAGETLRRDMLEIMTRRYYRIRTLERLEHGESAGRSHVSAEYEIDGRGICVFTTYARYGEVAEAAGAIAPRLVDVPGDRDVMLDFLVWRPEGLGDADATAAELTAVVNDVRFARRLRRIVLAIAGPERGRAVGSMQHFTFRPGEGGYAEERVSRGLHPMMWRRLQLWRLANFDVERLPSVDDVYLLRGVARGNPRDERLFAFAEVRDLTPVRDETGRVVQLPDLERMLRQALASIREVQAHRPLDRRLHWNRVLLHVWPPLEISANELLDIAHRLAPATEGVGLEKVVVRARVPQPGTDVLRDTVIHVVNPAGRGVEIRFTEPADQPIRPLTEYGQKVVRMRQRGLIYPYEIVRMVTPPRNGAQADFPPGDFVEHDFDASGALVPVERPYGQNGANMVVGVIRNFTPAYPEGMTRVILLGDPSRAMGALAEPECSRINAALDLAERMRVPLEWIAISAGAKISMESGTENMDWIARVLRRLIEFTQAGGEVNVVVNGINVGAQPYWNAEATMLMHTRGILIMTADGAMVLTGKNALDYSGGVSAEDNFGIGGYERIMGPNGQAQYWARDVGDAYRILLRYYEHSYVVPGDRFPRRKPTSDPVARDVRAYPHGADGFASVGEIFSDDTNPGRKKAFDIRTVMLAAVDQDHAPLERWTAWRDAEIAVVWDAHLGGYPVCLLGIESRPLVRLGFVPGDGPDVWTAGTLFPQASRKVARAVNAASDNRPLVVLANLSGFDGSPESMRNWQLEYGAEIGRAVVNFRGPIVFCVISRYHGGAFVVFSRTLNEQVEAVALEGTYASVIGGAPAAAVVFAGEVDTRTRADARVKAIEEEIARAEGAERARLRARRDEVFAAVRSEKLGQVADEFDAIHSVHRALSTGSLDRIIPPEQLRPYLIDALERGVRRELERVAGTVVAEGRPS